MMLLIIKGSSVSGGASSRYLMKVQTKVLTDARCRSKFAASYAIDSVTQLCAGEDFQNQDFCQVSSSVSLLNILTLKKK